MQGEKLASTWPLKLRKMKGLAFENWTLFPALDALPEIPQQAA